MSLAVTIRGQTASFFDSDQVIRAAEKGTLRALSRCGAFVRTEAKSSIRYAKGTATAGQPPKAHRSGFTKSTTSKRTGVTKSRTVSPLKELIYFAYDTASGAVVVGPAEYKSAAKRSYRVPAILEGGGTVHDRTPKGQPRSRRYAGNPFMTPALKKVQGKFPAMFTDLLRN